MKRLSFLKRLSAARARKFEQRRRAATRHRMLRMESLDSRMVLDGAAPTFTTTIGTQNVIAGAPLMVPLNASDSDSGPLTFEVTNVSDGTKLAATTNNANRSLRLVVEGFGEMWFELFEDKAPEITSKIIDLVNSGKWDNTYFHRIIDGFMSQGGGATPTGTPIAGVSNFDDQFHIDLMHTSAGILSMAKAGDDTNSSQFFITDRATRELDFNHSVFGRLVKGEDVRNAINSVTTINPNIGNNQPVTPVKLLSATIFSDDDNGVLFLKAPQGASGQVTVTVKVTDSDGNSANQTFTVNVAGENESVYPNNSYPFLHAIPAIFTTMGQATTLQIGSTDVEDNQRIWDTDAVGSVPYTHSISSTGVLSITPPANFVGTFQVLVRVRQAESVSPNLNDVAEDRFDRWDTQLVTVNVRPLAPSLVLAAVSDSGVSQTDGVTNEDDLQFTVTNVTAGATVNLYRGDALIETATATGTSVTFTTNKFNPLVDGDYVVSAKQVVSGVESLGGTFNLKLDRTAPVQVTPAPPINAVATKPYEYNAAHADEGQSGFQYSLANAPAGMTIDPTSGVISWTPTAQQVGSVTFGILATDAAGNTSTPREANVTVADAPLVQFILKVTDSNGNVLTSIANGQTFELRVFTKDLSPENANGVYSAYMDIEFDPQFADFLGGISYGPAYPGQQLGSITTPGLIDEVGAFQGLTPAGGELLLFKQAFTAKKSGVLTFTSNEHETTDLNDVLLNAPHELVVITPARIDFGSVSLSIDATVQAVADTFNVDEDSQNQTLNPLQNDTVTVGNQSGLIITEVGDVSLVGSVPAGTVTISGDGKTLLFTPKADFFGEATFTYTVKNTDNSTAVGTIKVQVQPKNDPPTAVNDTHTAALNAPEGEFINVLQNDKFEPDAEELLKVSAITVAAQNGTATVAPNGSGVLYKPNANFTGTDTFTYEITDPGGLKSTATVTVTVVNAAAIPVAQQDLKTVLEDSGATNILVLANDSAGINDTTNTLTVVEVSTTSAKGGTVTIAADGKSVNYTPKANFQGEDTFTYKIKDASGAISASGTVKVTVTNVNDAPTAVNDSFTVGKDSTTSLDLLKNDLSDPDPTEPFTIEEITGISNGGSVVISADKKTVTYKPAAGYTGTETFTYKMKDAGGLESTATVTVTILNFVPSKISGRVYFDANGDSKKQGGEVGIGGITIRIVGTSEFDSDGIEKTAVTDSQGRYTFAELPPGSYTITQVTMKGLSNTRYRIGTEGGSNSGGAIRVELGQNVESFYNDFMYDAPRQVGVFATSLFASAAKAGFVAAATPGANGHVWSSPGQGWAGYSNLKLSLAQNLSTVTVTGNDAQGAAKTATIQTTNAGRVKAIKKVGDAYMFQVNGTPAQIFGSTSGSGEPGSSTTNRSAGAASGEAGSANLSSSDAGLLAALYADSDERTEGFVAKTRGLSQSARAADFLFASSAK
jgi:cyclophilin family peptidyl-prolyl cis-trans isomerase